MMIKFKLLYLAGMVATAATLNAIALPTFSQDRSNQVTFLCRQVLDPAIGEKRPATVAWVPERKSHVLIVGWKSDYVPKWNPEKRCQTVTPKFQAAYDSGRLNYLAVGEVNNNQVICAIADLGEECNNNNQLFTIKYQDNPNVVFSGSAGSLTREGRTYLQFNQLLQKAPLVPEESISAK